MRVLINGGPALDRYGPSGHVGRLVSPRSGNRIRPGELWGADNDAYSAWDEPRFVRMLNRLDRQPEIRASCLFVAVPDVVADARATLDRFWDWRPEIEGRGFPLALVAQNGMEAMELPWDAFAALFLGGSIEWKLSAAAADLAAEAKSRGKHLHVGKVNTRRRLRICRLLHADTVDGTGWSKWPDKYLARDLPHLAHYSARGILF